MTTKNRLALLTAMATTPVFAAPFLAIGDNAELFLTARTEVRYEDNVTFSPDSNKINDEVFEFAPGVELVFGKNSLTKGTLSFYERFIAYSDNTVFNEELANLIFNSTYDGAKLKLNANASYQELNQNSRDANLNGSLVRRDVSAAGLNGELAVTEKSKVGTGFRYDSTEYQTNGFTDRETYTVPVNYYFAISPKVDLSAGLQYRINNIDAANADSEEVFYNLGARGAFTPKLTGNFRVGYSTRDPDAGSDSDTIGLDASLAYAYSPKTSFSLNAGNDFQTASNGGGQEVASLGFGVQTTITPGFSASASISYEQIDYINSNREDDYIKASVGLNYALNQHISLGAFYSFLDNSSDVSIVEFTANTFSLAANFRY